MPDQEMELVATEGMAHALIALAAAKTAGAVITPDEEGANKVAEYTPRCPYPAGDKRDVYLEAWQDVVFPAVLRGEVTIHADYFGDRLYQIKVMDA